jgi:hypothetical protein
MQYTPNKSQETKNVCDNLINNLTNYKALLQTHKNPINTLMKLEKILYKINQIADNKQKTFDLNSLINRICKILVELAGYHRIWICLMDESGKPLEMNHAGFGPDFIRKIKRYKKGEVSP